MRPAPYNPAKASTPPYWRHGFIWVNGRRYGVWDIAARNAKWAKKGTFKMRWKK
jgi:hypothetical protein